MSDETRTTYSSRCPVSSVCPWRVTYPHPELVEVDKGWHVEHHYDLAREAAFTDDAGLTCDPPRVPLPRTRDLTLTGFAEAVARYVWRWVR